jgi:preprotein translocase subunit SecE
VARDRQRAKQRRARRAAQNPGPAPTEPHQANVPGELEHASGEVDEFNAALVAGAGARDDGEGDPADTASAVGATAEPDARGRSYVDEELEEEAVDEAELERQAAEAAPAPSRRERAAAAEPSKGLIGRFLAFLRASWAELQRVQWPDRRQVAQATAVVIGFVIVAGVYLGVADKVAQEVVDFII